MSTKRRAGTTLPRHRSPAAPAPAPAAAAPSGGISRRIIGLIAAVAVLGALGLVLAGTFIRDDRSPAPVAASADIPVTARVKGNPAAPVTIIEYADLQCPACARFSQTVERQIEEMFIKTGIAKFEFRHFAFLGKESQRAAEASECAAEQGAFFTYRDALYAAQRGENRGAFSDNALRRIASETGLDTGSFNACFASGRNADTVKMQTADGKATGVQATPTFYVNGAKIEGLVSFDAFKQVIERAAAGGTQ